MKLAFSSAAFRNYSLTDAIGILSMIGYEGVEVMAARPHASPLDLLPGEIRKIKDSLIRHGLKVSNINSSHQGACGPSLPAWTGSDGAVSSSRVEHTVRCVELAHMLGAEAVSIEPGPGPRAGEGEKSYALFREGLLKAEGSARRLKIRLLIRAGGGLTGGSPGLSALMEGLDPMVFGLDLEAASLCHGWMEGFRDHVRHVHIKGTWNGGRHGGKRPGSVGDVLKTFSSRTGYAGFVTVVLDNHDGNPVEAAYRAFNHARRAISPPEGLAL